VRNLLIRNFSEFEFAFSQAKSVYVDDDGKRFHELEYGEYRERILLKLLKSILPAKLGIGTGFIVNRNNEVSTQCDLIIYDKNETPDLEGEYGQRFFPVEAVVGVGEVKSTIYSIKKLNEYVEKLSTVAAIKNDLLNSVAIHDIEYKVNPLLNPRDSIFTFIVCSDFKFKLEANKINQYGPVSNQINCILSIKDGLVCRKLLNGENWHLPAHPKDNYCELGFISKDKSEFKSHYKYFTSLIRLMAEDATVCKVDISKYIFEPNQISE
jgi:hypothetical protein